MFIPKMEILKDVWLHIDYVNMMKPDNPSVVADKDFHHLCEVQ